MTSRYRPTPDVAAAMRSPYSSEPDNLTSTNGDKLSAVLAIDPGPVQSAWLVYAGGKIVDFGKADNMTVLQFCGSWNGTRLVIEKVEGFGMPVGAEVFETVYWSGRFAQAAFPRPTDRIGRKAVKIHLCGSMRAKDPNIRQALIDRFGGSDAIGRKATPGPLYGISGDVWSALAVAVTWADQSKTVAA